MAVGAAVDVDRWCEQPSVEAHSAHVPHLSRRSYCFFTIHLSLTNPSNPHLFLQTFGRQPSVVSIALGQGVRRPAPWWRVADWRRRRFLDVWCSSSRRVRRTAAVAAVAEGTTPFAPSHQLCLGVLGIARASRRRLALLGWWWCSVDAGVGRAHHGGLAESRGRVGLAGAMRVAGAAIEDAEGREDVEHRHAVVASGSSGGQRIACVRIVCW